MRSGCGSGPGRSQNPTRPCWGPAGRAGPGGRDLHRPNDAAGIVILGKTRPGPPRLSGPLASPRFSSWKLGPDTGRRQASHPVPGRRDARGREVTPRQVGLLKISRTLSSSAFVGVLETPLCKWVGSATTRDPARRSFGRRSLSSLSLSIFDVICCPPSRFSNSPGLEVKICQSAKRPASPTPLPLHMSFF
jgi:hypothetical protein